LSVSIRISEFKKLSYFFKVSYDSCFLDYTSVHHLLLSYSDMLFYMKFNSVDSDQLKLLMRSVKSCVFKRTSRVNSIVEGFFEVQADWISPLEYYQQETKIEDSVYLCWKHIAQMFFDMGTEKGTSIWEFDATQMSEPKEIKYNPLTDPEEGFHNHF